MIGDMIFGRSAIRREILRRFFARPGLEQHARELAREIGRAPQPVARELSALERAGVLTSTSVGRAKRYRVNESSPVSSQIRELVQRTIGVEGRLREALEDLPGIEEAFIFGSQARSGELPTSDIDVMVIGPVSRRTLSGRLGDAESDLGREINVTRYTRAEVDRLRRRGDPFIKDVWNAPRVPLVARGAGT